jgi:hypothetical protein
MKIVTRFLGTKSLALGAVLAASVVVFMRCVAAEETKKSPFEGSWYFSFTNADGSTVTPRVKFKSKDGEITATSRFRSGSETSATNLVFKGNQVSFDIIREFEGEKVVTHYAGRLTGDAIKGTVTSKSHGEEHSYPWLAKRAVGIDGPWRFYVDIGWDFPSEARITFKQEGEKVSGKYRGQRGGEVDLHKGRFKDGNLSFEIERAGFGGGQKSTNKYRGKLMGDRMEGTVEMNRFGGGGGRQTNDWEAVRAD